MTLWKPDTRPYCSSSVQRRWADAASWSSPGDMPSWLQISSFRPASHPACSCNSDGPVYHGVEVRIDSSSNESPQLKVKATKKSIMLLFIIIHLIGSIAGQFCELM
jgi:hypothetical protein